MVRNLMIDEIHCSTTSEFNTTMQFSIENFERNRKILEFVCYSVTLAAKNTLHYKKINFVSGSNFQMERNKVFSALQLKWIFPAFKMK